MNDKINLYVDEKYSKCLVPNCFNSTLGDVIKSNTGKNLITDLFLFCLALEDIHPIEILIKHGYLIRPDDNLDIIPEDLEIPVLKRQ